MHNPERSRAKRVRSRDYGIRIGSALALVTFVYYICSYYRQYNWHAVIQVIMFLTLLAFIFGTIAGIIAHTILYKLWK